MQYFKKIFLLFIAIVALLSGILKYTPENNSQVSVVKTQHEKNNKKEKSPQVFYYVAYEAIMPAVHQQLPNDFLFVIFENELLQQTGLEVNYETPLYFSKYCRTLFRQIISPNAP